MTPEQPNQTPTEPGQFVHGVDTALLRKRYDTYSPEALCIHMLCDEVDVLRAAINAVAPSLSGAPKLSAQE